MFWNNSLPSHDWFHCSNFPAKLIPYELKQHWSVQKMGLCCETRIGNFARVHFCFNFIFYSEINVCRNCWTVHLKQFTVTPPSQQWWEHQRKVWHNIISSIKLCSQPLSERHLEFFSDISVDRELKRSGGGSSNRCHQGLSHGGVVRLVLHISTRFLL